MNRERAIRIHEHLLDAHLALDDAGLAIAGLGKEERLRFDSLLAEVIFALQQKLLTPIHDQYPDLEPPIIEEEDPTVTSELRWDQVRLPSSVSEADIDGIIFSVLKPRWDKTAKIIILVMQRCEELDISISDKEIAARLQVLADSDRIEGIGDLRMWFHSEVQLKG